MLTKAKKSKTIKKAKTRGTTVMLIDRKGLKEFIKEIAKR